MPRHSPTSGYQKAFAAWKANWLKSVLEQYGGNVKAAARAVGVSKHLFYRNLVPRDYSRMRYEGTQEWREMQ